MADTDRPAGESKDCVWCRQDGCTPDNDAGCPCPHHGTTCLNCGGRGETIGGYQEGSFVTVWKRCFACNGSGRLPHSGRSAS